MHIKINKNFATHKADEIIEVEDVDGVPVGKFWRRRIRDSAVDGCCSVLSKDEVTRMKNDKKAAEEKAISDAAEKVKEVKTNGE